MESLLYILSIPIGITAFVIAWKLYPKSISRRDRYHLSDLKFLENRICCALASLIVFGGAYAYFIYVMFHEENKVSTIVVTQLIDSTQSATDFLIQDYSEKSTDINSDEEKRNDLDCSPEKDCAQTDEELYQTIDSITDDIKEVISNNPKIEKKQKRKLFKRKNR